MNKKVMVLAVHPDDETLGAGGTLLRHIDDGDDVHWVICTEVSTKNGFSESRVVERRAEIEKVAEMYGFSGTHELGIPTMRADEFSSSRVIGLISGVIQKINPEIVYLPFKDDVHSDHRVMFDAAYACTKTFRYPSIKEVLMMETLSETDFSPSTKESSFVPNTFVDVSKYIERKLEIMKVFKSEIGEHPFPRSLRGLEALSVVRGASAGCLHAEAFLLLKCVR